MSHHLEGLLDGIFNTQARIAGKQRLKHQLKPTHLHKPRPEREIQSGGDQQHDEGGIPYDPIDLGNYLFEHGFKGTKNLPFWRLFLFGGLDASAPCVFQPLRQVGKALDGELAQLVPLAGLTSAQTHAVIP